MTDVARTAFLTASSSRPVHLTGIVLLISLPLMLILVGFATYGLALVFAFVLHLLGALKAQRGEWWNPPLTPRMVR